MNRLLLCLLILVLPGCDSGEAVDPPLVKASTQPQFGVEAAVLAPLIARHPAHIAIDARSNIYWVQESDNGDDLVWGVNESGVPEANLQLTTRRMLELLKQPGGSGNIQSIVVGPDDKLYIYFIGGKGRNLLAALAQYNPSSHTLRLLADTAQLMTDSKLGRSLDLARGTLLASPSDLWLWLRSTDASTLLRVDLSGSLARPTILRQPFEAILMPAVAPKPPEGRPLTAAEIPKPAELKLTSAFEDLTAADRHVLFYVDRERGVIWQIDALGNATVSHSLQGVPEQLTSALLDKNGRMHLIVGVGDPINVLGAGDQNPALVNVSYPALLSFDGPKPKDKLNITPRLRIKMPIQVPIEPMQITTWAYDRTAGACIAFDAASGELLKLRILTGSDQPTKGPAD